MFGNDFDSPIRQSLPYGTSIGYNILKWTVDPGIDGDLYADKPYIYGPALSSMNRIAISKKWKVLEEDGLVEEDEEEGEEKGEEKGEEDHDEEDHDEKDHDEKDHDEEDHDEEVNDEEEDEADTKNDGKDTENESNVIPSVDAKLTSSDVTSSLKKTTKTVSSTPSPDSPPSPGSLDIPANSAARIKFFLDQKNRQQFKFNYNVPYAFDFYNPYLNMGNMFAIHLPGFTLNVEKYWNGQPLRFTLKNRSTNDVYLVIMFSLVD